MNPIWAVFERSSFCIVLTKRPRWVCCARCSHGAIPSEVPDDAHPMHRSLGWSLPSLTIRICKIFLMYLQVTRPLALQVNPHADFRAHLFLTNYPASPTLSFHPFPEKSTLHLSHHNRTSGIQLHTMGLIYTSGLGMTAPCSPYPAWTGKIIEHACTPKIFLTPNIESNPIRKPESKGWDPHSVYHQTLIKPYTVNAPKAHQSIKPSRKSCTLPYLFLESCQVRRS